MSLPAYECAVMSNASRGDAMRVLAGFLDDDAHYRASAAAYGDAGRAALARSLDLFLARPEIGFVWLARAMDGVASVVVAACVVCRAISTSRGTLVAKLDDVTVAPAWRGRGAGSAMLAALCGHLRGEGVTRIDCGCHRDNTGAWRFYALHGFSPLDEERIALLL